MAEIMASLSRLIDQKQQSICFYVRHSACPRCTWTFRFMNLPLELRFMIYDYLFTNTSFELSPRPLPSLHCECGPSSTWSPGNFPPILSVSKEIRKEALPFFFDRTSVAFGPLTRVNLSTFSPATYRMLSHTTVASLEPSFGTLFIPTTTPFLPKLKEVRMRLCPATVGQSVWPNVDLGEAISDDEIIQRTLKAFFSAAASTHVCRLLYGRQPPFKIVLEVLFVDFGFRMCDEWTDMLVEVDLLGSIIIKHHRIRQADMNHWGSHLPLRWWTQGRRSRVSRAALLINDQGKTHEQLLWQHIMDIAGYYG